MNAIIIILVVCVIIILVRRKKTKQTQQLQQPEQPEQPEFNGSVPPLWIEENGKRYFRKYYYVDVSVEGMTIELPDCMPVEIDGNSVIYNGSEIGTISSHTDMIEDFKKRGEPILAQICNTNFGGGGKLRLAFYKAKEDLKLQPITIEMRTTVKSDDFFGDIDSMEGKEITDYEENENGRLVIYAGNECVGTLSENKTQEFEDYFREGYEIGGKVLSGTENSSGNFSFKLEIVLS